MTAVSGLIAYVPLMGPPLRLFLLGGDGVTGATLSRFLACHVAIVPGLLIMTLVAHFWMIRKQGISTARCDPWRDCSTAPRANRQSCRSRRHGGSRTPLPPSSAATEPEMTEAKATTEAASAADVTPDEGDAERKLPAKEQSIQLRQPRLRHMILMPTMVRASPSFIITR